MKCEKKYNILSWENLIVYSDLCPLYKIKYGLAPPVLNQFVSVAPDGCRLTRSAVRGDCVVPLRKSGFSQRVFSVRAAREWNSIT